jgi:hypothetical protein
MIRHTARRLFRAVRFWNSRRAAWADFVHQAHALDLPCLFVGDGALAYRAQICAVFGDQARFAPAHLNQVCASGAAVFAAAHPERMTAHDALLPQYLRASQAEREYAGRAAHG